MDYFFCIVLSGQADNDFGAILIYSKPDKVKIIIPELDYKKGKTSSDPLLIENVPEGNYNFKFRAKGYKIEGDFFLPANDTLIVLGNFVLMGITAVTSSELKELVKQDQQKQKFRSEIHNNVIILDGPGIPLDIIADMAWVAGQNRKWGEEDSLNMVVATKRGDLQKGKVSIIEDTIKEEVFFIVEDMPLFNGGHPAVEFRKFIAMNLRYPDKAAENNVRGRVIVQFAIDKNGKLVEPEVVAGVNPALDQEAIRVVTSSPLWIPGRQRGEAVKVLFTFPINFILKEGEKKRR